MSTEEQTRHLVKCLECNKLHASDTLLYLVYLDQGIVDNNISDSTIRSHIHGITTLTEVHPRSNEKHGQLGNPVSNLLTVFRLQT